jgi:hypothetical protein
MGERGTISGSLDYIHRLTLTSPAGKQKEIKLRTPEETYGDFGARLVANFVEVVAGRAQPLVPADSVLPALELMTDCYESATPMEMPWLQPEEGACYVPA